MELNERMIAGLHAYDVPAEVLNSYRPLEDGERLVLLSVGPLGDYQKKNITTNPTLNPHSIAYQIGFLPLFRSEMEENTRYIYSRFSFQGAETRKWLESRIKLPDSIDLKFDFVYNSAKLKLIATTEKNGRIVEVRKIVPNDKPLDEALEPLIAYFVRNCPRPKGDRDGYSCGEHIARLMDHIDPLATTMIEQWIKRSNDVFGDRDPLRLPSEVIRTGGIRSLELKLSTKGKVILLNASLENGHSIIDDDNGTEIIVEQTLPAAVASALKGRSVYDLLGLDWTKPLTIKLSRIPEDRKASFRASVPGVPFSPPAKSEMSDKEALDVIRKLTEGEHPQFKTAQASVGAMFKDLSLPQIAEIMTTLLSGKIAVLESFGKEGWEIRRSGNQIVLEKCPADEMEDIIKAMTKEGGGE